MSFAFGISLALLAIGSSIHAAPAVAPGPSEPQLADARQTFFAALEAQDAGRHQDALVLYARVEPIVGSPTLFFNMAVCHAGLGNLVAALSYFEKALAEAEAKSDSEVALEARARLAELRPRIPHVRARLAPGTTEVIAILDGAVLPPASLDDFVVNPGAHLLAVRSGRHDRIFELTFEITAGAERVVMIDLGPVRPPEAPRELDVRPSAARRSYVPAIAAGGAAVLFAAGAVATGFLAHDDHERYVGLNSVPTPENHAEREELRTRGGSLQVANVVLIGAAAIAASLGVYFLLRPVTVTTRQARPPRAWPIPFASAGGLAIGTF